MFRSKRSLRQWLDAYAVSHRNPINKFIHWFCVPAILFSILGLASQTGLWLTLSLTTILLVFYARLSLSLTLAMGLCLSVMLALIGLLPWQAMHYLALFGVAWLFQFIGHAIEGQKPSFLEDLQFLLIGPAWVIHSLLTRRQFRSPLA